MCTFSFFCFYSRMWLLVYSTVCSSWPFSVLPSKPSTHSHCIPAMLPSSSSLSMQSWGFSPSRWTHGAHLEATLLRSLGQVPASPWQPTSTTNWHWFVTLRLLCCPCRFRLSAWVSLGGACSDSSWALWCWWSRGMWWRLSPSLWCAAWSESLAKMSAKPGSTCRLSFHTGTLFTGP